MAILFVRSLAAGTGSGVDWTNAYLQLQLALNAAVTGDIVYMAHDHAEAFSGTTTFSTPNFTLADYILPIYRVDSNTDLYVPARVSAGVINIQSTTSFDSLRWRGFLQLNGVNILCGHDFTVGGATTTDFICQSVDCVIKVANSSAGDFNLQHAKSARFFNCDLQTGLQSVRIDVSNCPDYLFNGCSFTSFESNVQGLVRHSGGSTLNAFGGFIDCDLSGMSNDILTDASVFDTTNDYTTWVTFFRNCKLKDTYSLTDGNVVDQPRFLATIEDCKTTAADNIFERETAIGNSSNDTAIYFTGANGGINQSYIYDSNSNAYARPWQGGLALKLNVWLVAGTHTLTVEMLDQNSIKHDNSNAWLRTKYYAGAGDIARTVDESTRVKAALSYTSLPAGAGLGSWAGTTTGFTSVKLEQTITTGKAGFCTVMVMVGKHQGSSVLRINPHVVVT